MGQQTGESSGPAGSLLCRVHQKQHAPSKGLCDAACQEARPVFLSASHSCGSFPRRTPLQPPVWPFPWSGGPSPLRLRLSVQRKGAHSRRQSISHCISSQACGSRKSWLPPVGPVGDRSASCQGGTDTAHRLCLGSTAAPPDHEPFCSMSAVCPTLPP